MKCIELLTSIFVGTVDDREQHNSAAPFVQMLQKRQKDFNKWLNMQ